MWWSNSVVGYSTSPYLKYLKSTAKSTINILVNFLSSRFYHPHIAILKFSISFLLFAFCLGSICRRLGVRLFPPPLWGKERGLTNGAGIVILTLSPVLTHRLPILILQRPQTYSQCCSFVWLVLPFRGRKNCILKSNSIVFKNLHHKTGKTKVIFFSKSPPRVHSRNCS